MWYNLNVRKSDQEIQYDYTITTEVSDNPAK